MGGTNCPLIGDWINKLVYPYNEIFSNKKKTVEP